MRRPTLADPSLYAAMIAAQFAQELGLPLGNMWEPGIARNMAHDYQLGLRWRDIEETYRLGLGLPTREIYG